MSYAWNFILRYLIACRSILIRERLIPRAVLYYTGELNDDDDEDDEEGDDDYLNGDDEGSDVENDPDFDPSKVKEQPECKQQ